MSLREERFDCDFCTETFEADGIETTYQILGHPTEESWLFCTWDCLESWVTGDEPVFFNTTGPPTTLSPLE